MTPKREVISAWALRTALLATAIFINIPETASAQAVTDAESISKLPPPESKLFISKIPAEELAEISKILMQPECSLVTTAIELIRQSGEPGGICLVLGDQTGRVAAAVGKEGQFVVQALYSQPKQVEKARDEIRAAASMSVLCR